MVDAAQISRFPHAFEGDFYNQKPKKKNQDC